ncbi:hypothetical protein [Streptococcus sp. S784/96/1]|uniref:hypothetical protein n=1 Tax=Streptococcus sp. S784/96/1 TaxID=2653499 RepID=UPI001389D64F|nr:hypothetical protein [Streptococcus sp. S784/96/1]
MSKYKVSSIIMLTAFSLFASVSANADEVPTVSTSQVVVSHRNSDPCTSETVTVSVSSVVVSHRNSDPCTSETVEQGVNSNISAPRGGEAEGSEWVDEDSEEFNKIKKTVFIPHFFKFDFN